MDRLPSLPPLPPAVGSIISKVAGPVDDNNVTLIFVIAIIVILLIVIIIVLVFKLLMDGSRKLMDIYRDKPRKLFRIKAKVVSSEKLAVSRPGQDHAVSLWLYVVDVQASNTYKLILMRSPQAGVMTSKSTITNPFRQASPIIFMSPSSNQVYCAVRRNIANGIEPQTFQEVLTKSERNPYTVAVIDYLPMQRWVHVIVGTRDGTVTVHMNGSLYTVEQMNAISGASTGDFLLGSPSTIWSAEVRGFLSNVRLLNFVPSMDDVNDIFRSGPQAGNGFMATLGVSTDYRLRWPIYKVDDVDDDDDK